MTIQPSDSILIVDFGSQVEQHFRFLEIAFEGVEESDFTLDEPLLSQDLFRGFPILPEVGTGGLGLERFEALAQGSAVKDAS